MKIDVFELAQYLIEERLAGEPPSLGDVIAAARSFGIRPDCLLLLTHGYLRDLYPTQVRRDDHEMIECLNLAATAAGIRREIELY